MARWSLIGVAVGVSGCPTFTNLKTARALDQGEFQIALAPELVGANVPTKGIQAIPRTTEGTAFAPQGEVAGRYGVSKGVDLGLKVSYLGAEFDATLSLVKGPTDVAFAPGLGYSSAAGSGAMALYLPLLVGINLAGGHQVVFGAEAIPETLTNGVPETHSAETWFTLFLGGTAGVSLLIAPGFRIQPEIDLFTSVWVVNTSFADVTPTPGSLVSGTLICQGALAFSFGGDGFGGNGAPRSTAVRQ